MFSKKSIAYIVLVLSLALLVFNIIEYKNGARSILGIISNVLLMLAMLLVIKENNKRSRK